MKIWLDDLCGDSTSMRATPLGWVGVTTPEEAIALLQTNPVEDISLDNDLGLNGFDPPCEGRHVLDWIEAEVQAKRLPFFNIHIHTSNAAAARLMRTVRARVYAMWAEQEREHHG